MEYKHCCVIDKDCFYKEFVIIENEVKKVQYYEMQDGESLVDCAYAPLRKVHAESSGFIKPKWNGTEWKEGATEAEIAEWNEQNPAPEIKEAPVPDPDVWSEMAQAIAEGVNDIE